MDIGDILRDLGVPWPEADETRLREAAQYWKQLAEACHDACEYGNRASRAVTDNNAGEAIDAFERYWNKFGDRKGALPLAAQACDELSKACDQCADAVAELKQKIEHAGEETLAAAGIIAVGVVGTVVTVGVSDGIADTVAAGLVSTAVDLITTESTANWIIDFGTGLSETIGLLSETAGDSIAEATASLATGGYVDGAASVVGGFGSGFAGGAAGNLLMDSLAGLVGQKPESGTKLLKDLAEAGLENGVGGVLTKLQEVPAARLADIADEMARSVETSDPQRFVSLTELARQIRGTLGTISRSTLASLASQFIVTQHADATNIVSDNLTDQLDRIARGKEK